MILSGKEIVANLGNGIEITPFNPEQVNPNSYNLRLHNELLVYDNHELDMRTYNSYHTVQIPKKGFLLLPGTLYLGRTVEYTKTTKFVPMLEGRSSIGRLGINIHATAGFGDVGFNGFWTLEISCVQPVWIYPDVEICQIYYHEIKGDVVPYRSGKYQNNNGIQPSLLYKDFQRKKVLDYEQGN